MAGFACGDALTWAAEVEMSAACGLHAVIEEKALFEFALSAQSVVWFGQ